MKQAKVWINDIAEIGTGVVALGVLAGILFGDAVPFVGNVVANLTGLIDGLGQHGLVGLIALGVIVHLFRRK